MEKSKFYLYTIGEAASDKPLGSYTLEVFPSEMLPNTTVDPSSIDSTPKTVKDSNGSISSVVVNKSRTISCEWLPIGDSNRTTPPDVTAGEKVFVYRYGDTDLYFWTTAYFEIDLRKHESVTWLYSNKPEKSNLQTATINAYRFVVDTLNKFLELFTNNNDGEYTTYNLSINTKDGVITIIDGKSNVFCLESQTDTLTINLQNELNIVTTNKVNVLSKEINIKAGGDINIEAGGNIKVNSGSNLDVTIGANYTSTSTGPTNIKGSPVNIQ